MSREIIVRCGKERISRAAFSFHFSCLAVMTLLISSGCGYTFGLPLSEDLKTVQVDIAGRWKQKARGLEFEITRAVHEEIQTRTHLRPTRSGADAVLKIFISEYKVGHVSSDTLDKVIDANLLISADIKITIKGKTVFEGLIDEREAFSLSRGETELTARSSAAKKLARKIVNQLAIW